MGAFSVELSAGTGPMYLMVPTWVSILRRVPRRVAGFGGDGSGVYVNELSDVMVLLILNGVCFSIVMFVTFLALLCEISSALLHTNPI